MRLLSDLRSSLSNIDTMSTQLPQLPKLGIGDLDRLGSASLRIRTDEDVLSWKATPGYQNYLLFLRRLNESVVNHDLLGEIPRGASAVGILPGHQS